MGAAARTTGPARGRGGPPHTGAGSMLHPGARPAALHAGTAGTGGGGSVAAAAVASAGVPDRPARYTRCNW